MSVPPPRWLDEQTEIPKEEYSSYHAERRDTPASQTYRQPASQTYRHTDKQTDRQIDREDRER